MYFRTARLQLAKENNMEDPCYPCHNYQNQASICIRPRKEPFFQMWKGKYPLFETRPTSQTHTQPTRKALSLQQLNEKELNWWGQEKLVADMPVTKTKQKEGNQLDPDWAVMPWQILRFGTSICVVKFITYTFMCIIDLHTCRIEGDGKCSKAHGSAEGK